MIFSNLAGTTSKKFAVASDGKGQIVSNNAYDIWWAQPNGASGERNNCLIFLDNGDDLNNAFTPAQYFKSTVETVVANNPTTSAFVMVVEPSSGDGAPGYVVQRIYTVYGEVFIRARIDGNWQAWKKVAYTSDVPTIPTLHAIATSGDYNDLINKPNSSSGPTLETGSYTLSSSTGWIDNDPVTNTYIKYGNVVQVSVWSDVQPNDASSPHGFTVEGWPFPPKETIYGILTNCSGSVTTSTGSKPILFCVYRFHFNGTLFPEAYYIDNNNFSKTAITNTAILTMKLGGTMTYLTK